MKSQKGITLVSLILTIVLMMIIAGATVYTSTNRFKINNLNKLYNDIDLLNDKINNYYVKYGGLPVIRGNTNDPILYTFSELDFDKNINDNENYEILDLEELGDITLNYGEKGYKEPNTSDDVYIINEKTHTIYYVKGIEFTDGKIYHTKSLETKSTEGTIPPTKPSINIIDGDKISENQYETTATIEFVSGKDNNVGADRTTYSINSSPERNIDELEKHQYKLTQKGIYEVIVKTYNNNNITSEETKKIQIGIAPNGYMPCDYVTNGEDNKPLGNAVIDTGILPSNKYTIKYKFQLRGDPQSATYKWVSLWGSGDVEQGNRQGNMRGNMSYNTTKGYSIGTRPGQAAHYSIYLNDYPGKNWSDLFEYEYDAKTNQVTFNGNTVSFGDYTFTSNTKTMLVGAAQSTGYTDNRRVNVDTISNVKIYDWQIWDEDTLVQWLVPCYKNGIGYMYDIVSDTVKGAWKHNNGNWKDLTANLGYGFD